MDTNAIWDILVEECGASDNDLERQSFDIHFPDCVEYRFQGNLGFGGKVRYGRYRNQNVYVDYYPEDKTPERDEMVRRANQRFESFQ